MTKHDWLKFVGVYFAGAVGSAALGYLTGRETLGQPLAEFPLLNGALVATLVATRSKGPGNPNPWRLAIALMAALAVLGVSTTALVGMTVGWRWGTTTPLEFTVPLSVALAPLFVWTNRRKAGTTAVASDSRA